MTYENLMDAVLSADEYRGSVYLNTPSVLANINGEHFPVSIDANIEEVNTVSGIGTVVTVTIFSTRGSLSIIMQEVEQGNQVSLIRIGKNSSGVSPAYCSLCEPIDRETLQSIYGDLGGYAYTLIKNTVAAYT